MKSNQEKNKLQEISESSLYSAGVMQLAIEYCFKILSRYISGERVLELGPAEGVMTELLITTGKSITVVEGSKLFCDDLKRRFSKIDVVHCLFEEYVPSELFDTIILGHVLEHVEDPVAILKKVKSWVKPGGNIFAAVPNARSLHRQAAVDMGLLEEEAALNSLDLRHGHRRVFSPEDFRAIFLKANLKIDVFGGYWLKPISNGQIESSWTAQMISAFMKIGERYPDIAGEIYVVASN
ncbi:class I SAM-dependent methyltransferase [Polynucleobacter sp. MWH-Adler-W8]|uniref:class I SAM-dependent methyltransferase n=1 Tax=Polynucleobacter sp. MWH-Adler-W8 TaxID=1819727 RepID=UPI00092A4EC7|nr:class I SAM-dependent methyltransferase [Polynucleobacter sp. MWH-Adler-W8]OJI04678.1 methyltransferase type 12 [Polynucleobacter sp. MWH-Adler-W8]